MKIQCNACEMTEASVLCCADEAALCLACDEKIHAVNKLASKHLRVPLSNSSSKMPKCDICQETTGYFFCLEDRALLCRKCDVAIHTANSYVSAHQRFLLTGVKVGLEPKEPVASSSKEKMKGLEPKEPVASSSKEKMNKVEKPPEVVPSKRGNSMSLSGENKDVVSCLVIGHEGLPVSKVPFSGGSTPGIIPDWSLEEFLGLTDFNHNYGFMGQGSSKGDCAKLGDSEWSPIYRAVADEDVDIDECLGQVPEIPWTVPEIPSPPTASGLYWPKNIQSNLSATCSVSVPDVCCFQTGSPYQLHPLNPKRRRQT